MLKKLTSRKFLLCLAAFLASIATSIAGLHSDNETVIIIGMVCSIVSAAIYSAAEAFVDAKAVESNNKEE